MALERKDVKVYLDADVHAALKIMAVHKDVGLAEYIEALVAPHVKSYVHDVMVLADEFKRSGIDRQAPESSGTAGK